MLPGVAQRNGLGFPHVDRQRRGAERLDLADRVAEHARPRRRRPAAVRHDPQRDAVERRLVKLKGADPFAAVHQVREELAVHDAAARQHEVVADPRHVERHQREVVAATAALVGQARAVLVSIPDERHAVVPERGQNQRRRDAWSRRAIGFDDDVVGADVHAAMRTLGGDVLDFAAAIEVVDAASEDASEDSPLRRIQLFGGREYARERAHAAAGRLDEFREPREGRGISEGDRGAELRPSAQPALHFLWAGVKWIELVHPPRQLPQFELGARHPLQALVAAPEEGDHLAETPAALEKIPVGPGVGRVHVNALAEEGERFARRSAAVMPVQALERDVLPDEIAPALADDVLGQDG